MLKDKLVRFQCRMWRRYNFVLMQINGKIFTLII